MENPNPFNYPCNETALCLFAEITMNEVSNCTDAEKLEKLLFLCKKYTAISFREGCEYAAP